LPVSPKRLRSWHHGFVEEHLFRSRRIVDILKDLFAIERRAVLLASHKC
jgi:hypothetical protein